MIIAANVFERWDIMIDNEINIYGQFSIEFRNRMMEVDLKSIEQRDLFISGVSTQLDKNGALVINVPNLEVDLNLLESSGERFESFILLEKKNNYVDNVSVTISYVSDIVYREKESNIEYKNNTNNTYVLNEMKQGNLLRYAA